MSVVMGVLTLWASWDSLPLAGLGNSMCAVVCMLLVVGRLVQGEQYLWHGELDPLQIDVSHEMLGDVVPKEPMPEDV